MMKLVILTLLALATATPLKGQEQDPWVPINGACVVQMASNSAPMDRVATIKMTGTAVALLGGGVMGSGQP
ncbi:unnamed protein product [Cutaneotrichosporon oleaginosum]